MSETMSKRIKMQMALIRWYYINLSDEGKIKWLGLANKAGLN